MFSHWLSPAQERRRDERQANLLGIARAYVLVDGKAHLRRGIVFRCCDGLSSEAREYRHPLTTSQMRGAGAPQKALARLREGNLGIDDRLGPWTGSFFFGLRLSGALAHKEKGQFRVNAKSLPALVRDIAEWPIAGKLGCADAKGRRRLIRCPAALYLPPEDPEGVRVIAGLLAGARLVEIGGSEWLELPAKEEVKALLDKWTIRHEASRNIQGKEFVRVSPFYAALVTNWMPAHSAKGILNLRKPALCPLLSVLYFHWCFDTRGKGRRIIPFADALPFGCSPRTFYRRGWRRKDFLEMIVSEFGIAVVNGRLRELMHDWFHRHQLQRASLQQPTLSAKVA